MSLQFGLVCFSSVWAGHLFLIKSSSLCVCFYLFLRPCVKPLNVPLVYCCDCYEILRFSPSPSQMDSHKTGWKWEGIYDFCFPHLQLPHTWLHVSHILINLRDWYVCMRQGAFKKRFVWEHCDFLSFRWQIILSTSSIFSISSNPPLSHHFSLPLTTHTLPRCASLWLSERNAHATWRILQELLQKPTPLA